MSRPLANLAPLPRASWLPDLVWGSPLVTAVLAVLLGAGVGLGVALTSPLVAIAFVVGLGVAAGAAFSIQVGLLSLVVVASLLPFGVIPVRIGVQLTVVDALVGAVLLGWLARVAGRGGRLELTPVGRLAALYVGIAVAALLAGATHAPLDGPIVRGFLKYATAILLFLGVADAVRNVGQIRSLVRLLILGGALAAAIGLAINALPRTQIVELLSSLSVIGYPSGREVLRFRPGPNNTYTDVLRATGTSIDPNILGGLLMLAGALMLGQWFAPRRAVPRWALLPLFGVTVAAMVATDSRSSWVGLAVGWAFLALFREKRLWLLAIPVALALLALPIGREMLERLASGFAARDRAAALRLDEYRQALQIIAAYPLLGVGFAGAPELGTFVGVSSIYLLVGEHTGLLGLGCYVVTLATLLVQSIRALGHAATPEARGLIASLQAPFVAALTAGLFDHYFMNPRFPHMVALFWLYAGLLAVATRLANDGASDRRTANDGAEAPAESRGRVKS